MEVASPGKATFSRGMSRGFPSRDPMRPRHAISPLAPDPNADLDDCADCPRVLPDRRQRGARVHAAFKTRHGAPGTSHPVGDILLRHARCSAGGDKVSNEHLQRAIRCERSPAPCGLRASGHEMLDVPRKCAILFAHGRVPFPGLLAIMLTPIGVHCHWPFGCARARLGVFARLFGRGTGVAILLTRSEPRASWQAALPPGGRRLSSLLLVRVSIWPAYGRSVAEVHGTTNCLKDRSWPVIARLPARALDPRASFAESAPLLNRSRPADARRFARAREYAQNG